MRLYPYNNVCEKRLLFTPQYFDPDERDISGRAGFTTASSSSTSGRMSAATPCSLRPGPGRRARVLAVEPQPDIFERLVYNIRQNPFGTVKARRLRRRRQDGRADPVRRHLKNQGESSVKIVGLGQRARRSACRPRRCCDLLEDEGFDRVDAIKLDVEGAEDLILEPFLAHGARTSLLPPSSSSRTAPGAGRSICRACCGREGYRLVAQTRVNLIFERKDVSPAA